MNPTNRPLRAFAYMLISSLCFAVMIVLVKAASKNLPAVQLVFFRSIVNWLLLLPIVLTARMDLHPRGKGILIFRGLAGLAALTCYFYSIRGLPVSVAAMLGYTAPLFVIFYSRLFLNERLRSEVFVWVGLSLVGMYFLIRPEKGVQLPALPILLGFGGASFSAMAYVAIRSAVRQFPPTLIVFYFTTVATFASLPFFILEAKMPTPLEWGALIGIGVLASLAQHMLTQGYRWAAAGLVSTMSLMTGAFAVFFGWLLFGETLREAQWLGIVLLGTGIALTTLRGKIV